MFDTYADLKQEVISFSGRDDLSDRFDSFLKLTESQMFNHPMSPLRVREMETTAALVTVGGTNSVALPADFLEARSLSIQSGTVFYEMEYVSPSTMVNRDSGLPTQFTIKGTTLVFNRTPDGVYNLSLDYYAKPLALSTTDSTNAILTNYPDIYFNGCLMQVYKYATETQEMAVYKNEFMESIRGANKASEKSIRKIPRARVSGSTP